jgi:dUTP pyrophosphatase
MDLNTEFKLEIYKCKEVKTPSKAWEAAGWDFYIPENLSIFDFVKDPKTYLDDSIVHDKNIPYEVPLVFYLKSPRTVGEFPAKLVLSWNKNLNKYVFNICEKKNNEFSMISFEEVEHEIMKWLTEKTTVISRIEMQSLSKVLIPSGIHAKLPENVFLKAENKSGIASKRSLIVGACVIDTDYEGEIHINLINCSNNNVILKAGEKIVQFVRYFQPVMNDIIEYNSKDELYKGTKSKRGSGGFGSSGIK